MTDRDIVERVASIFERAVVPVKPRKAHHKIPYVTSIKGSTAVDLMRVVQPFMGRRRSGQIAEAINSWNGITRRSHARDGRCPAVGCERPVEVRGMCRHHYKLWWKSTSRGRSPRVAPVPYASVFATVDPAVCVTECDVSWLAGLLEGEGTFSINRQDHLAYPMVSIHMTDKDVISRAATILGASGVWFEEAREDNWSPTFLTSVSGAAGSSWMIRLHPLMGDRRRDAIERALAAYHPIRLVNPPSTCVVPDCAQPHESRGLCHKHYMSWSRDVARGRSPRVTPLR